MKRTVTAAVATLATLAVVMLGITAAGAAQGPSLRATLTYTSDWGTGYVASVQVENVGDESSSGWVLEFELPETQTIGSLWNGVLTRDGTRYTVTDAGWNGSVPPGGAVTVGFDGTYSGSLSTWSSCTVDGNPCDGSGPTPTPTGTSTSTPTSTPSPTSTATSTPSPTTTTAAPGAERVVGYFTQWGIYGRDYTLRDVQDSGQAQHLTHLHYAFVNVTASGECATGDSFADWDKAFPAEDSVDGVADTWDGQVLRGNFNQILELKAANPGLRAMVSLGGWTWSRYFSDAALTEQSRERFVRSCVDQFIRGDIPPGQGAAFGVFDGIDLDWEWPASEGNAGNVVRPEDRENFVALVAEFREQLDAVGAEVGRDYELSAFLPADPRKIEAGIDVAPLFEDVDYATVQGYDFHGAWESQTNHQANLRSVPGDPAPVDFSLQLAVDTYLAAGAPADKLVPGVPAYGRGWTGVAPGPSGDGLWQTGRAAPGTYEQGVEDYKVLAAEGAPAFRDTANGAYWTYDGTELWTYDDPQLVREKMDWIDSLGLGGAMIWSLDGDDGDLVRAMGEGLG